MKLWIGGEIQTDIGNAFREARNKVEKTINSVIDNKDYDLEFNSWDVIVILRDDDNFKEITKYSKKKKDMDFRLRLNHKDFADATQGRQEAMIVELLLRSLKILKEKGSSENGVMDLRTDVLTIAKEHDWIR
jgi:hypothetical protein